MNDVIQIIKNDPLQRVFLRLYERSAELSAAKICLDVCCGYGWGSSILSRSSKLVVGVDNNCEKMSYANKFVSKSYLNFCVANATSLCFTQKFEIVTIINGYQYVTNTVGMLKSISGCLRDNGLIFLATRPTGNFLGFSINEMNDYLVDDLEKSDLLSVFSTFVTNEVRYFSHNVEKITHVIHVIKTKKPLCL